MNSKNTIRNAIVTSFASLVLLGATAVEAEEPISGKGVYQRYCSVCHGVDAKGQGPMAELLKPVAADLTLMSKKNQGLFDYERVFEITDGRGNVRSHGSGQMPIWGDAFARDSGDPLPYVRILELVFYLKSIQVE